MKPPIENPSTWAEPTPAASMTTAASIAIVVIEYGPWGRIAVPDATIVEYYRSVVCRKHRHEAIPQIGRGPQPHDQQERMTCTTFIPINLCPFILGIWHE